MKVLYSLRSKPPSEGQGGGIMGVGVSSWDVVVPEYGVLVKQSLMEQN
jgi:hypothetical protein